MITIIIIGNIYWVLTMSGTMLNVLHSIIPFNYHKYITELDVIVNSFY